jgi:hypothetical protein
MGKTPIIAHAGLKTPKKANLLLFTNEKDKCICPWVVFQRKRSRKNRKKGKPFQIP